MAVNYILFFFLSNPRSRSCEAHTGMQMKVVWNFVKPCRNVENVERICTAQNATGKYRMREEQLAMDFLHLGYSVCFVKKSAPLLHFYTALIP